MVKRVLACLLLPVLVASLGLVVAGSGSEDGADVKQALSIYYAKPDVPPGQNKDKDEPPVDNSYYELLGTKLAGTSTYYVNLSSAPNGALSEIQDAFEAWDVETSNELFVYGGETGLLGNVFDGQNTIGWRGIIPRAIVAMASIWYIPATGEVVEFDITFNALQKWGIDPDDEGPQKLKRMFDVENVATHEVGHIVGLADLYDEVYRELTMYGYTSKSETQKISLEEGDIAGTQELYGAPTS